MNKHMKTLESASVAELEKMAHDLRVELTEMKRSKRMGELQKVQTLSLKRKELARVLTKLTNAGKEERK